MKPVCFYAKPDGTISSTKTDESYLEAIYHPDEGKIYIQSLFGDDFSFVAIPVSVATPLAVVLNSVLKEVVNEKAIA